ncbi:MFS transporter [Pseudothauera nasutitermitis]|uniref:MFS transporter n=1 Tax=Pseudothauera nasutitermitis TaxID=2565930 RepID=A0A4S4AT48_9RHOO|nr:MFS transporter [Pseudothauera nasutitermitis]THF63075.1 MFS transporter [Pseudothauera nasutitermitis]
MSNIQSAHVSPLPQHAGPTPALVLLLACGAGLSVASLYYSQPMLGLLGADLGATAGDTSLIPTFTQLGYALGILLLAPLGDRYDRRLIIVLKAVALTAALLASGCAPGIGLLLAASLGMGLAATLAQDILPTAATLAPAAQRGRIVGTVMTGLLLGILLSRVVSGFVAEQFGWRAMYFAAALPVATIGVVMWYRLPHIAPTTRASYLSLLGSLGSLWRRYPALRRAALAQGLLSVGFSAFWSTLAIMLHAEFGLGSAAAGAFGLAGAAGALAAPLAGRLADRRGPRPVAVFGAALTLTAFAILWLAPLLSAHLQLVLLVVGAIGFDFGIQAVLVAHQTIVYGLDPDARSRINAVLITGMFAGMAAGSALGGLALARLGWAGVVGVAVLASAGALLVRLGARH